MGCVSPLGPVYQAGTLSGNPVAVAAGLATLAPLDHTAYDTLERLGQQLETGFCAMLAKHRVPGVVQRVGSMLTLFFTHHPIVDFASANSCDRARFARFHRGLLGHGIYWPPSQLEAAFISLAHTSDHIHQTIEAADAALSEVVT
jgi:glutamate-1-semialdehyde 2,1-aminomutase